MPATPEASESQPYPETWEQVAELRVFRATSPEWASLIQWRREMRRKGWKLRKRRLRPHAGRSVTPHRATVVTPPAVAVTLVAGMALACAGTGGTPSPGARPPGGNPAPVRLATDTAHYRVASYLAFEQEVNGQTRLSGTETVYYLTVRLTRGVDRVRATLVLDSIPRYTGSGAVDSAGAAAARGTVFQGSLSPTGEMSDLASGDSTVRFVRELAAELRDFFPRILATGVLPGQRWVDTTERQTSSSGVPLALRFIGEHEVGEPITYLDRLAIPIRSRIDYTLSGTGSQGGQEFRVEGTGRGLVTEYLGLDGRFLGLASADSSTFTIDLPAVGTRMPGRQTRADTVTVVR